MYSLNCIKIGTAIDPACGSGKFLKEMYISLRQLEIRYRYATSLVYNTFPWCKPTPEQRKRIERTAQAILNARALYSECSLAELYDELTMPPELRKAHQQNDLAVMNAYGFSKTITESECVAELMKLYQKLTDGK